MKTNSFSVVSPFSVSTDVQIYDEKQLMRKAPFAMRSGIFGPHFNIPINSSKQAVWEEYSSEDFLAKTSLKSINIGPSPVVRVELHKGYKTKFRIPQLAGYIPLCGWPKSDLPPRYARASSGVTWDKRATSYFFEIPIQHLIHGMKTGEIYHQCMVFKSISDLDPMGCIFDKSTFLDPLSSPYCKPAHLGSKSMGFVSDRAESELSFVDNPILSVSPEVFRIYEKFENSGDINALINKSTLGTGVLEASLGSRDCVKVLTFSEFSKYLAYWILLYPYKWQTLKGTFVGPTASPCGKNPGYIHYSEHSSSANLRSTQNVYSAYYEADEIEALVDDSALKYAREVTPDSKEYRWKPNTSLDYILEEHAYNHLVNADFIDTCFVIRSWMDTHKEQKKMFNHFPFKHSVQSRDSSIHPFGSKTHLSFKDYKTVEQIFALRQSLDESMALTHDGSSTCPKCGEDLVIPLRLFRASKVTDKLVCWPCGHRYLINYVNQSLPHAWFHYEGYPVREVF